MGKSRKTHRRRNLTNKKHRRNLTNKKHRRNLTNKKHHNNRCIAGGVSGTYKTKMNLNHYQKSQYKEKISQQNPEKHAS